jgi:hypothetical protein
MERTLQAVLRSLDGVVQAIAVIDAIRKKECVHDLGGLDEKVLANLEYLLLRLRDRLIEVDLRSIVQITILSFLASLSKVSKFGASKWMSEYADTKRPLSTTWPWAIRPALAVLWGVCWMFYPPQRHNKPRPRPVANSSEYCHGKSSRFVFSRVALHKQASARESQLGACSCFRLRTKSQTHQAEAALHVYIFIEEVSCRVQLTSN